MIRCTAVKLLSTSSTYILQKMTLFSGELTLEVVESRINSWLKPHLYAETWDNVGILVGSLQDKKDKVIKKILVCNDLTPPVMEEAITSQSDMIVTYHPIIFKPLKTVAYSTWNERIVAKAIANDIVIYSPHTAVDNVPGGVNDNFVHVLGNLSTIRATRPIISKDVLPPRREVEVQSDEPHRLFDQFGKMFQTAVDDDAYVGFNLFDNEITKRSIRIGFSEKVLSENAPQEDLDFVDILSRGNPISPRPTFWPGAGRYVLLNEPVSLKEIVDALKVQLSTAYVQIGGNNDLTRKVSKVGICAGSGGSLLKDCPKEIECFITGEMSHHEILDFIYGAKPGTTRTVILLGHCVSERHYMKFLGETLRIILNAGGDEYPDVIISEADNPVLSLG